MEYETHQKRFCIGNTEVLRVRSSVVILSADAFSHLPGEKPNPFAEFYGFYEKLIGETLRYAEESLFEEIKTYCAELSEYDRKFHPPRYVYAIEIDAILGDTSLETTVSITLKKKGQLLCSAKEVQLWAFRDGVLVLIPPPSTKNRKCDRKKRNKSGTDINCS